MDKKLKNFIEKEKKAADRMYKKDKDRYMSGYGDAMEVVLNYLKGNII